MCNGRKFLLLFVSLSLAACVPNEPSDPEIDDLDTNDIQSEVITTEVLSAAQFQNAKSAASALGSASLSSNSAEIQTLVSTTAGQLMFTTIVKCALPAGQSVTATGPSGQLTFNGELGVASAWRLSAPTSANKRWTTACVLSRTNAFGLTLSVSVRHDTYLPLLSTAPERATYATPVGGFYGDLFQASPKIFACGAISWPPGSNPLVECARTINGVTTVCGFSWTGLCTSSTCADKTAPFGGCTGQGALYTEIATLFIQ